MGIPGLSLRAKFLTAFWARIGPGVVLKPRITIKFPWRLEIGAHSWNDQAVWIGNHAEVRIGPKV